MTANYSRRTFNDGDVIFAQNQRAGEAYLIQLGKVRLEVTDKNVTKEIDTIGKGTIFGEMGVISDMNRMASAIAVGETTVLCCHREELHSRIDDLDEDRRDALRFLIVYNQNLLPFELMENRPDNEEAKQNDKIAYYLVNDATNGKGLVGLDIFITGLYKVLINYAERRLPPGFKP